MPRRSAEQALLLVAVTDRKRCRGDLVAACEAAVRGGATAVLLRDTDLPKARRRALARKLRSITERYGATLIVHTDVALALAVGADGVHFSAADGARRVKGLLVGVSCHSVEEILEGERAGADYAFFGPVHATRSHPGQEGFGVPKYYEAREGCGIPVVAIGGMTTLGAFMIGSHPDRLLTVEETPLTAAVDALVGAEDPVAAASDFLGSLTLMQRGEWLLKEKCGERQLIRWIVRQLGKPRVLRLGPGDDAAVLETGGSPIAISTDLTVEKVHYRSGCPARDVGFKAAGRALSDLAAVGANPMGLMIGLAIRKGSFWSKAAGILAGAQKAGRPWNVPVLGGDTKETPETETVSVTALGRVDGPPALPRSGGRPGDILFVTGPLGGSIHGRHLKPAPRIAEGIELRRKGLATACIDISDGLATDLHRLCRASKAGALVESWRVPIHRDARRGKGKPLDRAFFDGEDYELLFAAPAEKAARIEARGVAGRRVFRIGRLVHRNAGVVVQYAHGIAPLPDEGWTHFRAR